MLGETDFPAFGLAADWFYRSGSLTEGFGFSLCLCLFLSGICLLQQLMIHSVNIYSPLTLGNFLPLMPTWPHWILTVNSERRNGSFGYIIVSSVLPGSLADLIGIIIGSKNLHYCTHAIRKALCKVLGVSRK